MIQQITTAFQWHYDTTGALGLDNLQPFDDIIALNEFYKLHLEDQNNCINKVIKNGNLIF